MNACLAALAIDPSLYKSTGFDPVKDFEPIAPIADTVAGYGGDPWVGLFAVRGTPADIQSKLGAAVNQVMAEEAFRDKLEGQGARVPTGTPAQLATQLKQDIERWAVSVKESGATVA
jgi:hypothetical protein